MQLLHTFSRVKEFINRRRSIRFSTRCPAWIEFDDDTPPLRCTLLDVSEGGARISVAFPKRLPERFALILEDDVAHARRCRVVWRGDAEVGISYLDPYLR
jgi:c-di-GMP-binding flagellar brake protein YcgR